MKNKTYLSTIILTAALLIGGTLSSASAAEEPHINVSASAVMELAPDTATINFEITGKGGSADQAVSDAAGKMTSVKRALLGLNILGDEITTASYHLAPVFDAKGRVCSYAAHNSVRIKLNDLKKLGAVIDKISAAGVEEITNISFDVSNKSSYRNTLLAQAVANAKEQAAAVATAGGRTLGKLLSANINNYNGYGRTYSNVMLMAKSADVEASPATTIEAEDITIRASVDTVFSMY